MIYIIGEEAAHKMRIFIILFTQVAIFVIYLVQYSPVTVLGLIYNAP